jgi:hypothetical protein
MMRKSTCISITLFAACADPGSLRVRSEVTPEIAAVSVTVFRSGRSSPIIECRFEGDGTESGRCPFEERAEPWQRGAAIDFVLYGDPGIALEVALEGFDDLGVSVTSTRAFATLTSGGADRTPLSFRLEKPPEPPVKKRTEVHRRCEVTLPESAGQRDQTAMMLIDEGGDGKLEIVAVTPRRMSFIRYASSEDGCTLTEAETRLSPQCARAHALAAGEIDPLRPGDEIVAACSPRNMGGYKLRALAARPDGQLEELASVDLDVMVAGQVTRPVLFDANADGNLELALLAARTSTIVELVLWRPAPGARLQRYRLPSIMPNANGNITHAPIVLPRLDGADNLFVVGNRGGSALYDPSMDQVFSRAGNAAASALDPALAWPGREGVPVLVLANGSAALVNFIPLPMGMARSATTSLRVVGSQEIAIAIGDVDGSGANSAVWAADDRVAIAKVAVGGATDEIPLEAGFGGPMLVLLANLDGEPGSEIVAFGPTSDKLQAIDHRGRALDGWPIRAGTAGTPNRLALADLDGDGSAEVLVLSFDRMTVLSLGAGSWDRDAAPWPLPFRDRRQSAVFESARDPTRRSD